MNLKILPNPSKLLKGRLVRRKNRFVAEVELGPERVEAYLANPGRLQTVLVPGRRVLLQKKEGENRRLGFDVLAVDVEGSWVLFMQPLQIGSLRLLWSQGSLLPSKDVGW